MAARDEVIIPVAASCEQRGKSKTNKDGCHPASVPIETFFASTADAFPGDNEWTNPLKRMKRGMAEATRAAQEGNLTEVHEVLEGVVKDSANLPGKKTSDVTAVVPKIWTVC